MDYIGDMAEKMLKFTLDYIDYFTQITKQFLLNLTRDYKLPKMPSFIL